MSIYKAFMDSALGLRASRSLQRSVDRPFTLEVSLAESDLERATAKIQAVDSVPWAVRWIVSAVQRASELANGSHGPPAAARRRERRGVARRHRSSATSGSLPAWIRDSFIGL